MIGCGWITEYLKPVTKNIETVKIVAAVDPLIERANLLTGENHSYKNVEKMYKNEDIDMVYIATPHHLHKPMIEQAFKEGKHIFCEKPVSTLVEEARKIYELDKKYRDLKLGFNYQYRYDHNCYTLAAGIQNGHLGEIYYANCNIFFSRELDYFKEGSWRAKRETAGGGTLLIQGSHIIDIIIWSMGEPISVIGMIDNLKFRNIEVEDIGFGIVKFESGSYAQINGSMIVKQKRKLSDRVELKIFGENGNGYYEGPWPLSSLKWDGVKDFKLEETIKGTSHFGKCIKAYANWVLHNEPFFNTIEESSKVLRLISALYKSSKTGKKEQVEKL